ncbi:MAG: UDP-3-O-(3-hydroxymyristoyl)glucosamine N-acyltransferase [Alphaproteobacteria bacterium]
MANSRFYSVSSSLSIGQLGDLLKLSLSPINKSIKGINTLEHASSDELVACFDKKSLVELQSTKAGVCLTTKEFKDYVPAGTLCLELENPRAALARVAKILYPEVRIPEHAAGKDHAHIHPSARVADTAFIGRGVEIGEGSVIGHGSYIGSGVQIGKNCHIHDHVSVVKTIIGDHVVVHAGARLGFEGFGFVQDGHELIDIPHLGTLVIKDHVRIGANTTIDRGVLGDTIVGEFCRIDNLVQIAHNVRIGKGCIIVSQVGIAGSTEIGDFSVLAGQAGLSGHLKIGKKVTIAAQSGVMRDIPDGETVGGSPAVAIRDWHRQVLHLSKVIKK